jgi:hypothetical protein
MYRHYKEQQDKGQRVKYKEGMDVHYNPDKDKKGKKGKDKDDGEYVSWEEVK